MASALQSAAMMAVERPMPVAAPVMMMRFPVRSAGMVFDFSGCFGCWCMNLLRLAALDASLLMLPLEGREGSLLT